MSQPSRTPTLLADLGGTNVRFALADTDLTAPLLTDSIRRYRVTDFDTLAEAIRQYFVDTGFSGDGSSPCRRMRFLARSGSAIGVADSKAAV